MSQHAKKKAKPKKVAKKPTLKKAKPKVTKKEKAEKEIAHVEKEVKEEATKVVAKAKKAVEKIERPTKSAVKAAKMKFGLSPAPTVSSRHLDSMHDRPGKGFSPGELSSAGIALNLAKREDLSIDRRRRSVIEGNVEALKGWMKSGSPIVSEPVAVSGAGKKK